MKHWTIAPAVLAALACIAPAEPADVVGSRLDDVVIEDLAQTEAESFADFTGRAILIEFFAYW